MPRILSLLPLLIVAASTPLQAAQDQSAAVDAFVQREMASRKIPGLSVAVMRGGKVVKTASFGKANIELDVPVTDQTLFQINSTTKSFAAVAVLMLVEAGKILLDDPIGKHVDSLPAAWRPVTIRQLLSHTSGLPDIVDNPMTGTMLARNVPDALRLLGDKPAMFARGTSWSYNQTNYMLLAMLIEQKSGLPFARFCLEKELAPLGIKTARFGDSRITVPGRATGYTKYNTAGGKVSVLDQVQNTWYEFEPFLYTAAALNISARDFATWTAGLMTGKLISRASLEEIWKPTRLADGSVYHIEGTPLAYGLGWPLVDRPAHRAAGGSGGVRAGFFIYPEDDLAVVVLTNLMGAEPESLVEGVAALYVPGLKPVR